ncbi:recombinase family protein [Mucilaginibacter sp. E4BP6]|uniref:recombinase family protein n=1 Tax=Mucilaginibacter sp. E4BP6 TaxID=2723089 RepID=UPI0015CC3FAD|nr:recombinase family protein [Mucilaginibacter sp. E4BP6]NYE66044.1 DNA invertase Pin-like site-specific DNA recombinase [Mucilaginibacter sp. E4BP6]
MRVKYNRVSTIGQSGNRFINDTDKYDLILLDKISGNVAFKERPQSLQLIKLIEAGKVNDLVVEEFSRLGRNTGDVINTLDWLDQMNINVTVRNVGLQSRPNGIKNPIWKMISSIMSSLYEMELQNIKERTTVGRIVYVQNGGILGRPKGTNEQIFDFLNKPLSKQISKCLDKGLTVREIGKIVGVSSTTVMKVKKLKI